MLQPVQLVSMVTEPGVTASDPEAGLAGAAPTQPARDSSAGMAARVTMRRGMRRKDWRWATMRGRRRAVRRCDAVDWPPGVKVRMLPFLPRKLLLLNLQILRRAACRFRK